MGCESFVGGYQRINLCCWNKFTVSIWSDKQPYKDNHTDIFPLNRSKLSSNPALVQNSGDDF